MKVYYNEFDKENAEWLRQLMRDGLITKGEVDERSIVDVDARDVMGFDRVHWFAGIGTWDYCLNESGWGERKVWTASLPCQPFSSAGKQLGKADERHLLPHFLNLVRECRPDTIYGEQVPGAIRHGWLDDLQTSMEAEGYAVGHCVFGAHSTGAPHIRQRLYWVANASGARLERRSRTERSYQQLAWSDGMVCWIGNSQHKQHEGSVSGFREKSCEDGEWAPSEFTGSGEISGMEFAASEQMGIPGRPRERRKTGIDWIACRDGKYRPIKSRIKPLVDGPSRGMVHSGDQGKEDIKPNESDEARAMRIRGYGNAIVAGCAIEFISTFMEYRV